MSAQYILSLCEEIESLEDLIYEIEYTTTSIDFARDQDRLHAIREAITAWRTAEGQEP